MTEVFLDPSAVEDLEDTADYLDEQTPGLDIRFLAEVQRTLRRLSENPRIAPEVGSGVHRIGLYGFSYNVYYRIEEPGVVVFAILHQRRDPRQWQRRL